jgi:radical SAM protein with 4Fe4S-binding SPASM domain
MSDSIERLLNVYMDQNNKCNLRCIMCGFSDPRVKTIPKYDMPYWLFEKIAREIFPHAKFLALSCLTEPLMTKDFPQRLDLIKTYAVPFTEIVTNGILLNEAIIVKMIDARISRLAVSIDSANPITYESIRVGARFDKVISNIRMFNALRREKKSELPKLRVNHVISDVNIDEFQAFLDLAESLEVQAIDVRTVMPFQNAAYQGQEDNSFYQRVALIREKLRSWTQKTGVEDVGYLRCQPEEICLTNESSEKITCRRPWDTVAIHANGDVLPCITWSRPPLGNIAEQNFAALWDGHAYTELRKEFERRKPGVDCLHCVIRKGGGIGEDDCFFLMLKKRAPKRLHGSFPSLMKRLYRALQMKMP